MKNGVKGFKSKYTAEEVEAILDGASGGSCTQPWDPSKAGGYADPCLAIYSLFYVAPIVSVSNNVNVVEIGSTVNNVTVNWSISGSGVVMSQSLTDVGSVAVGTLSHDFTGLGLTNNKTWSVSITDDHPTSANGSTTIYFRHMRHWGTDSNDSATVNTMTDAQATTLVLGLANEEFATSRGKNWTQNGNGEYIIYSYPVSWGESDPPSNVNGLPNTAWTKIVKNITNSSGHIEPYNIWISNTVQNGTGINIIWL